ncbi:MAG TPA: carboxypeptidase-like regulatory domain-containing protein [Flavilitoribacter sp.]|nr:carboxypeptidase-like regulatory domain-containing protein [Flavilitoribacter sp.]
MKTAGSLYRPLLLTICLCLSIAVLHAQPDSVMTLVFRIPADRAADFYQDRIQGPEPADFIHPVDSFFRPRQEQERTPGHYLYLHPDLEGIAVELKSYYAHEIQPLNDERDLALQIAGMDGRLLTDAKVRLGKKEIPFDPETSAYRLKRRGRGGFLRVDLPGDTLFLNLAGNQGKPVFVRKFWRFSNSRVGRVVTIPVRWPRSAYLYLKRGFGYGDWRMYRWPFNSNDRNREFQGYMAFDKPRYRPGDTLKVKAYVARKSGRPYNRPLEMALTQTSGRYRRIMDTLIKPADKGVFLFEMVLSDTLQLDQGYSINFDHPRNYRREGPANSFHLEDYELEEAFYTLSLDKSLFNPGEKIRIHLTGKDANDLPVPDGEAILTLMPQEVSEFYTGAFFLPDTLWHFRQELGSRGEADVLLPDSLLPPADLMFKLEAVFVRSDGQMETKSTLFTYKGNPEQIRLKLEGPDLVGEYLLNGNSTTAQGQLSGKFIDTLPLTAPFRIPVNPFEREYAFRAGNAVQTIVLGYANPSLVSVSARWDGDSIAIRVMNPRKLPVTWLLRTLGREMDRGSITDSLALIRIHSGISGAAELSWSYPWGGSMVRDETTVLPYKKLLTVSLDQPQEVWPGQEKQIRVKVEDYRGRPAKNVNLAVGAVNAQFKDGDSFQAPDIRYRIKKEPFEYNTFRTEKYANVSRRTLPVDKQWYTRFGLEKELFYRLRFPENGVRMEYDRVRSDDDFYWEIAQFAPYIVREGKAEPVYLIYCNRKLVYYYGSDEERPYSFAGRPGYNTITVRTLDAEYTIDSVLLRKGWKLEMSVDADHFGRSPMAQHIRVKAMPKSLTTTEAGIVRNAIFILRKYDGRAIHSIWDSQDNLHIFSPRGSTRDVKLGPFAAGSWLYYLKNDGDSTAFRFEPGFTYVVSKNRERLYETNLFPDERSRTLPQQLLLVRPGKWLYSPGQIPRKKEEARLNLSFSDPRDKALPGEGSLVIKYPESDSVFLGLVVVKEGEKPRLYRYGAKQIQPFLPGIYRLYAVTNNGYVAKDSVRIQANGRTFHALQLDHFRKDGEGEASFFLSFQPEPAKNNWGKELTFKPSIPSGPGRMIRGRLVDSDGEPLIGGSVLVKGTTTGTVTDIDGYYEIWVPEGADDLVISYTGFETEELQLDRLQQNAIVQMNGGANLSEVVVTAYGIARKQNLTGAVSTLSARTAGVEIRGARSNATDYYIDGIRVGKDRDQQAPFGDSLAFPAEAMGIRSRFSDAAFWQPNLMTDADGEAWFTARFPDNITAWNTFALGMDRRSRGGVGRGQTRAVKPIQAQLSLPRFLVEGDRSTAIGRSLNFTGDTLQVRTFFKNKDREWDLGRHALESFQVDSLGIEATSGQDSLKLTYGLETGNYLDGEERNLPVFPVGVEETEGAFYLLEKDTSLQFLPKGNLGTVHIYAENSVLELLLKDLDYLRKYPYGCNEQTASRLVALLLEKEIRGRLGQEFDGEQEIRAMVSRLRKTQRGDGSWGWWADGEGRIWVSVHVLRSLYQAAESGYKTDALEKGLRWLVSVIRQVNQADRLQALDLLSGLGQKLPYEGLLSGMDTLNFKLKDKFTLIAIRQRAGLAYSLDSLDKYRYNTLMGGSYWNENKDKSFFGGQNKAENTLLAHEILLKAGRTDEARRARQYFLENRGQGMPCGYYGWYNTLTTARILQAILPQLLDKNQGAADLRNTLTVNGRKVDKFPFGLELSGDQPVTISKTGAGPLFVTAYQQFWQPDPQPKTDIFEVSTTLKQNGRDMGDRLEKQFPAEMEVTVRCDADAEHVLIEVPIPAGCSYGPKTQYGGRYEVYREYNRNAAAIFCEKLPAGEHTFTVALEPRFSGRYTINPAKAEQMYFPVFYGRNGIRRIIIP